MAKQLFTNPDGRGGNVVEGITFAHVYRIVRDRIEYMIEKQPTYDIDAVCQNVCVEIEKVMGTYPNV